ncbi:hypothetical protein [Thermococcus prieurii]
MTMIVMKPPYPYRLLLEETPVLLGEVVFIPLLIVITLLLVFRFDAVRRFISRHRYLALLLIAVISMSFLVHGHVHKGPNAFVGVKPHWNNALNLCGGEVYYVHRNAASTRYCSMHPAPRSTWAL